MDALHTRAFLEELVEIYASQGLEKDAAILKNLLRTARVGKQLANRQVLKADKILRDASIKAYVSAPESVKKLYHGGERIMTDPDNTGVAATGTLLRRLTGQ